MRRPRRDAPPALMRVPTPTPPRRPTRPYLPGGHTRTGRLDLAYRADAAVFARRAYPHRTPRPGLPRPTRPYLPEGHTRTERPRPPPTGRQRQALAVRVDHPHPGDLPASAVLSIRKRLWTIPSSTMTSARSSSTMMSSHSRVLW